MPPGHHALLTNEWHGAHGGTPVGRRRSRLGEVHQFLGQLPSLLGLAGVQDGVAVAHLADDVGDGLGLDVEIALGERVLLEVLDLVLGRLQLVLELLDLAVVGRLDGGEGRGEVGSFLVLGGRDDGLTFEAGDEVPEGLVVLLDQHIRRRRSRGSGCLRRSRTGTETQSRRRGRLLRVVGHGAEDVRVVGSVGDHVQQGCRVDERGVSAGLPGQLADAVDHLGGGQRERTVVLLGLLVVDLLGCGCGRAERGRVCDETGHDGVSSR